MGQIHSLFIVQNNYKPKQDALNNGKGRQYQG